MTSVVVATALFCGAYAVIGQSYLAREFLVVFLGNEISLAVLLAGWLVGVAAGARAARLSFLTRYSATYLMVACLAAWVVLFPATLVAVRASRPLFGVPPGEWASLFVVSLAALLFAGTFSSFGGFLFVTLCRLFESCRGAGNTVGIVYIAEACGSVAGGVLFTFALAGRVAGLTLSFGAYVPMGLLCAAIAAGSARSRLVARRTALTLVIGTAVLSLCGLSLIVSGRDRIVDSNSATYRMQTIAPGFVVESRETRYQNLTTVLVSGQYTVYGNGEPLMTFPDPYLEEKEAFTILAQHESPTRVLVMGGGPSFLAAVRGYGVASIDYVETDPVVVEVAKKYVSDFAAAGTDSADVHVHFGDARRFLEDCGAGAPFDVIIVRMPDPRTLLLNRFQTREFLELAARNLSSGGVFALPVTLADGYLAGEVGRYASDVRLTMSDVFADVLATPDVDSIFLACPTKGVLTTSVDLLAKRFVARNVRSSMFPEYFAAVFPPDETVQLQKTLSNLSSGEVNRDWRPTTYGANLEIWAAHSGSKVARWVLAAVRLRRGVWAILLILAAAAAAALPTARRRIPGAASVAIAYTGFTAMSMAVLLIYAFQVKCGYVYEWIGLLTASFVGGLALGGAAGSIGNAGRARLVLAEAVLVLVPVASACCLAYVARHMTSDGASYAIPGIAAVAGLAVGFEFPIAASVLAARGRSAAEAGSRLQILDQAGACVGALLTGVIIIPALGMWWSLAVLAAVKMCSAACVIVSKD